MQEVEREPLAGEEHVGEAVRAGDDLAGLDLLAVGDEGFELLLRVERGEDGLGGFEAGDRHRLLRDEAAARVLVALDARLRRDVAAAEVFGEERGDLVEERAFVEPAHYANASRVCASAPIRCAMSATRCRSSSTFSAGARSTKFGSIVALDSSPSAPNFSCSFANARAPARSRSSLRADDDLQRRPPRPRGPRRGGARSLRGNFQRRATSARSAETPNSKTETCRAGSGAPIKSPHLLAGVDVHLGAECTSRLARRVRPMD